MNIFEDEATISDVDVCKAHDEIVEVIKKYTSSTNAGKYIIESLNLDRYSKITNH